MDIDEYVLEYYRYGKCYSVFNLIMFRVGIFLVNLIIL